MWSNDQLETMRKYAFTELDYIGDGCDKFVAYLQRCWTAYQDIRSPKIVPCAAVLQSSGFGKSRLLYQFARETQTRDELQMRVLYICTRIHRSSGYPSATIELTNGLLQFTSHKISLRLEAIYRHAYENWPSVGDEWINLFTDTRAAGIVENQLINAENKLTNINAKRADLLKASTQGNETAALGKLVILAVDSASGVLTLDYGRFDYTLGFRRALIDANERIHKYHPSGGIFAVLVDRDTKIAGFTPSAQSDELEECVFPPFVLTHTMDAFWKRHCAELGMDDISAYKFDVTQDNPLQALKSLILMGRPLWG